MLLGYILKFHTDENLESIKNALETREDKALLYPQKVDIYLFSFIY